LLCNGGCRFYNYLRGDSMDKKDPRMEAPLKNINPIIKTPKILNETSDYSLNSLTTFRKEKDNIYTFFNGSFSNILFVNEDFKNFICVLKKTNSINFGILKEILGDESSTHLKSLLNVLLNKNFLIEKGA
jgi:UDP-N-acetylenolpyruvoylglucosamine reductase